MIRRDTRTGLVAQADPRGWSGPKYSRLASECSRRRRVGPMEHQRRRACPARGCRGVTGSSPRPQRRSIAVIEKGAPEVGRDLSWGAFFRVLRLSLTQQVRLGFDDVNSPPAGHELARGGFDCLRMLVARLRSPVPPESHQGTKNTNATARSDCQGRAGVAPGRHSTRTTAKGRCTFMSGAWAQCPEAFTVP
jgi:hypothetical protein